MSCGNEQALGFAAACNAGAAAATSEFHRPAQQRHHPHAQAGWRISLRYAIAHPDAAIVGTKLLFPNDTIQHAGVVFGLDCAPHHIYAGFSCRPSRRCRFASLPGRHRRLCPLPARAPWQELGGLDTAYHNGWEDVDYCLRAGEAGYEVHYCAESVVYHLESATRDLLSAAERGNRALFAERWREYIVPDDFGYYWLDGLLSAIYGARYPIQLSVSPLLAGVTVGENDRLADKLLYDRARQVMILLRNNIVLNVRVQEAEARAAEAERRLTEALMRLAGGAGTRPSPAASDDETLGRRRDDCQTRVYAAHEADSSTEAPENAAAATRRCHASSHRRHGRVSRPPTGCRHRRHARSSPAGP